MADHPAAVFPFVPWSKAGAFSQERTERIRAAEDAVIEAAEEEYNAHEEGRFVDAGIARAKTRAAVRAYKAEKEEK